MKKILLLTIYFAVFSITAQNAVWYENNSNTSLITFKSATQGTYNENTTNHSTDGIVNRETVSKYVREPGATATSFITYDLPNKITNLSNLEIILHGRIHKLKTNNKIRVYLRDSNSGSVIYEQLEFLKEQEWERFRFKFYDRKFPEQAMKSGGFNQLMIALAPGNTNGEHNTYHLDRIVGSYNIATTNNAATLSGSWGLWFQHLGGLKLEETYANKEHYYVQGANELVAELPNMGHVFCNLTSSAWGNRFTMRNNNYIDVVNEIHPDLVPSSENEKIVLDLIDVFKSAGKKVILYINISGPRGLSFSGIPEITAAWENYYLNNAQFTGTDSEKEGQAYRLLCRGFMERCKDLGVDGYWLDASSRVPGTLEDFTNMIRDVDPDVLVFSNTVVDNEYNDFDDYFKDEDGNYLFVDTDNAEEWLGVDDETDGTVDNRDYRIKAFDAGPYGDVTGGHPSPVQSGASTNSWAYEEYTHKVMVDEPFDTYDGSKLVLRHHFVPIRQSWGTANTLLMFDEAQAYRFVRRLTDAGASLTWSTSHTDGITTQDELEILKEIDRKMGMKNKPDYIPYTRPEGAFLVGEGENNFFIQENTRGFCDVTNGTIESVKSGYTSDGYVATSNTEEASVTYEITGNPGVYTFEWKHTAWGDRPAKLIINGQTVISNIAFTSSDSWSNWKTKTNRITITEGGTLSITLQATTWLGLPNIDYMKVYGPSIKRGNCNNSSKSLLVNSGDFNDIQIYPNPSTDKIQFTEEAAATVFTITGEKVLEFETPVIGFDVSSLSPGIYILHLSNKSEVIKLIIK